MKNKIWQLALPLTIISFGVFTKWWYTLPVDAPDTVLYGFPLPYVCNGWHTSLSLQIFVLEFIFDLLVYFSFWLALIWCINKYVVNIKPHIALLKPIWGLSGLIMGIGFLFASNSDNIFYLKRWFDIKIIETGYDFRWEKQTGPDFNKYRSGILEEY